MKFVDCTRPISVKSLAAGLLIVLFAIPSLAVAQVGGGCAGAIDVENNGTNFTGISVFSDYYKVDLPDSIRWTLNPKAGGELIVSTNQVRFGLTCSNNGDSVPCAVNDEQAGNPGVTPIVYTPLVGDPTGTCGATLASNVNGTLLFDLPSTELDGTGCTIEFETELQDIGGGGASGDLDPQFITSSVAYTGTCENGSLNGNAAGSIAVEVWDPEIDVTKTGPELAKKGDNIQYEIGCSVVRDPEAIDVCTGNDPLLGGDLGVFDCVNGETRTFPYTVKDDDPNPLPNEVTITCTTPGSANTVFDQANWSVPLIDPQIQASKTGPEIGKAGDNITYTIGCSALNDPQYLGVCTASDDLLGDLGVFNCAAGESRDFPYTVPGDATGSVDNTVKFICDINDRDNKAEASASHSVTLIDPGVAITKTGPEEAKAGDSIEYEICVENTGSADLENCALNDSIIILPTVLFDLAIGETSCTTGPYTVQPDDPDPLVNNADVRCEVVGFDNEAEARTSWSVDLYKLGGELTKTCDPLQMSVGETINWEICVENTGEKDITCDVTDTKAFTGTKQLGPIVPAGKECLTESRPTTVDDVPSITNEAKATCVPPRVDNTFELGPKQATCEVIQVNEICRTPGFWKTHGGAEKAGRSTNLVREVIDWTPNDTLGLICGVEIDNTSVNGYSDPPAIEEGDGTGSALEGMCVHPKTKIIRQLMRQLIAASLNCVASGGSADCTGVSVQQDWQDANADCTAETGDLSGWVDIIDDFNNGLYPGSGCTENLRESVVFENVDYKVPGPAGSSNACNAATYNDFYHVPK